MIFRKSTLKDCSELYKLICNLEEGIFQYEIFESIYKSQMADENYYCLVCEEESEIIGMLNMRFEEQLHHCNKIAEIMEFIINESHRDKGIGKKMFMQAEKTAMENNCIQMELASNKKREGAHRFYINSKMKQTHYTFTKKLTDVED